MDNRYITKKISSIRRSKDDFFFSNIFTVPKDIEETYENENGIAFVIDDKGVKRAYLAANDVGSIRFLLEKLPVGTGIEIITEEMPSAVADVFKKSKCELFATYLRASNKALIDTLDDNIPKKFKDIDYKKYVQRATLEYLDQIYDLLYETFNPLTSHLQSREELKRDILEGNVNISTENGIVQTVHTYEFIGKKLNLEHLVNKGASVLVHSLYYYTLRRAADMGINYAYTWMRDDNERIWAFTKRYGIIADGVKNFVYVKK